MARLNMRQSRHSQRGQVLVLLLERLLRGDPTVSFLSGGKDFGGGSSGLPEELLSSIARPLPVNDTTLWLLSSHDDILIPRYSCKDLHIAQSKAGHSWRNRQTPSIPQASPTNNLKPAAACSTRFFCNPDNLY